MSKYRHPPRPWSRIAGQSRHVTTEGYRKTKYMALIYTDPTLTPPMGDNMNQAYFALNQKMKAAGVMVGGDALHPASTATSVRVRGGKGRNDGRPLCRNPRTPWRLLHH